MSCTYMREASALLILQSKAKPHASNRGMSSDTDSHAFILYPFYEIERGVDDYGFNYVISET